MKLIAKILLEHAVDGWPSEFVLSSRCVTCPRGSKCPARWEDTRTYREGRTLTIGVGGTECRAWTQGGATKQFAHPSVAKYHMWLGEHAAGRFDLFFTENAKEFPPEVYCGKMRDHHSVMYAVFGPEHIGECEYRSRFHGSGANRAIGFPRYLMLRVSFSLVLDGCVGNYGRLMILRIQHVRFWRRWG